MIEHIHVMNRYAAENLTGTPDTAVISVTDTDAPEADLKENFAGILRLRFDDIDPEWCARQGVVFENRKTFDENDAMSVKRFVYQMGKHPDVHTLVVHCEMGISRSGAIAEVVSQATGARVTSQDALVPNSHVVRLLTEMFSSRQILRQEER